MLSEMVATLKNKESSDTGSDFYPFIQMNKLYCPFLYWVNNSLKTNSEIKKNKRHTFRMSRMVSANPTTYMAAATALANENTMPIAPPNSGPRLRDIR